MKAVVNGLFPLYLCQYQIRPLEDAFCHRDQGHNGFQFSDWGAQSSSIRINWKLVRIPKSQVPSGTY